MRVRPFSNLGSSLWPKSVQGLRLRRSRCPPRPNGFLPSVGYRIARGRFVSLQRTQVRNTLKFYNFDRNDMLATEHTARDGGGTPQPQSSDGQGQAGRSAASHGLAYGRPVLGRGVKPTARPGFPGTEMSERMLSLSIPPFLAKILSSPKKNIPLFFLLFSVENWRLGLFNMAIYWAFNKALFLMGSTSIQITLPDTLVD